MYRGKNENGNGKKEAVVGPKFIKEIVSMSWSIHLFVTSSMHLPKYKYEKIRCCNPLNIVRDEQYTRWLYAMTHVQKVVGSIPAS